MLQKTVGFSGFGSKILSVKNKKDMRTINNVQDKSRSAVLAKVKFDPRKLMEQAIEVMQQSVPQPREHSNTCPPIATFAHGVVQKLLEPDNGTRRKGIA